ncbi:hypothetical protein GCM10017608_04410 [Agromyces luteolus]|uniref:DUF2252 domain-containing protein n=1 Tax=Agromyces luteolus TaxID=88373 RepID=UPI00197AA2FA|nr:DUF2252 domain-containing protein [Agromyces luteolus]GLK26509.1 hypothetical protein GCM10017608_04410 [Agromyces luteolus]
MSTTFGADGVPLDGASADGAAATGIDELAPRDDFGARASAGRAARARSPRRSHAGWTPPPDRPDPVALLEEQAITRVPELVPIRYARMARTPFDFFRGAALIMAADLATTPVSGITAQICGDAHLSNFGVFASPERDLVFDINDFDETLPGPWEWDLKRLAASLEVAGRHRGFTVEDRRRIVLGAAAAYRRQMRRSARERVLEAWYDRLDADEIRVRLRRAREANRVGKAQVKRTEAVLAKSRTRDSVRAFSKLVAIEGGRMRIIADPPLIVPVEDLVAAGLEDADIERIVRGILRGYRTTLRLPRHPVDEYEYVHMARKVVGVGSVGTRAWIVLLRGRGDDDPLILQAKQAEASVLERFLPASRYAQHGERVVQGQRLMQSASDLFLGWQRVTGVDGVERDFYIRQLHDWKGSADIENQQPVGAAMYAEACGETLARAHARAGDRVAIAEYLGSSDRFDRAILAFAEDYADQNDRDFAAFTAAIASGRLPVAERF